MKYGFSFLLICVFALLPAQKKWSLQECVDYALQNNLQVLQNTYQSQIQDKNLEIAKRERLPGVSATWNHNANFGKQQFGSVIQRNDSYSNSANVGADILLYNNGRLEKNVRRVGLEADASRYDTETVKNNIALQIAQQYLTVLLNKEVVFISESAYENARKMQERAKITTQVGTTARTVLAEADAALAREKQNLTTAKINVKRSLFDLAQTLRLEDYENFDVENVSVADPDAPLLDADQIIATAYDSQPQVKAAEYRIRAAEAQTEVTKTNFWPSVSANAGVGTFYFDSLNQSATTDLFRQYSDNFSPQLGVSARFPIFNKGITRLHVEQSRINEEIAKTSLAQQKQGVLQSVQKAAFDAESNYEIYIAARQAEESTRLAQEFAEKSFAAGRSTVYDLNVARNNYVNAQSTVAQAKYNYLFSLKLLNFYAGIPFAL